MNREAYLNYMWSLPHAAHAHNYGYGYYTSAQHHGYPSYNVLWCEFACVLWYCVPTLCRANALYALNDKREIYGSKNFKLFRSIFIFSPCP
jgi:hypothetical protein